MKVCIVCLGEHEPDDGVCVEDLRRRLSIRTVEFTAAKQTLTQVKILLQHAEGEAVKQALAIIADRLR